MTREKIIALCEENYDEIVAIRRELHQHPEIGRQEFKTTEIIIGYLEKWGISYERLVDTGVVATVKGEKEGITTALRADIDALRIEEKTDVPFKSCNNGFMHACGHDIHTASLLGAAKIINENKDKLEGTVKFFFQSDEEGDGGAQRLIEKGAMQGVDRVFGLHVRPEMKSGTLAVKYGKFYAASDIFEINVIGKGGHCAEPHKNVDAIVIGAQIITALQTLVSRNVSPLDSTVLTIGTANGGTFRNTIAGEFSITGVTRSLGHEMRMYLRQRIKDTAEGIAKAMGGEAVVRIIESYPGIINDDKAADYIEKTAKEYLGAENVSILTEAFMTTEDFGYYLYEAPGCFYHIGCESEYPLHSDKFCPDEKAILTAMIMHTASVLGELYKIYKKF